MSRRYGDRIAVRSAASAVDADSGPEQFQWRGRNYLVHAVLAHWIEVGPWWRFAADLDLQPGITEQESVDPSEREVWRVEATANRGITPGVYDLCRDGATGWRLVRTID